MASDHKFYFNAPPEISQRIKELFSVIEHRGYILKGEADELKNISNKYQYCPYCGRPHSETTLRMEAAVIDKYGEDVYFAYTPVCLECAIQGYDTKKYFSPTSEGLCLPISKCELTTYNQRIIAYIIENLDSVAIENNGDTFVRIPVEAICDVDSIDISLIKSSLLDLLKIFDIVLSDEGLEVYKPFTQAKIVNNQLVIEVVLSSLFIGTLRSLRSEMSEHLKTYISVVNDFQHIADYEFGVFSIFEKYFPNSKTGIDIYKLREFIFWCIDNTSELTKSPFQSGKFPGSIGIIPIFIGCYLLVDSHFKIENPSPNHLALAQSTTWLAVRFMIENQEPIHPQWLDDAISNISVIEKSFNKYSRNLYYKNRENVLTECPF